MKTLIITALVCSALSSFANSYTFRPSDRDLNDLDHHEATTWGITWDIPDGEVITGARLTINNIWDWKVESDSLFIHLLDDPHKGVHSQIDNSGDNVMSDAFSGQGVYLDTWHDSVGGHDRNFDYVYDFSASDLSFLANYITDPNTELTTRWGYTYYSSADFGFGFDPDCHYYNSGVCFVITTSERSVPDTGSTLGLLFCGCLAVFGASRLRLLKS